MLFKYISYLELWWPFYSAEHNHLGKFSRGHHEKHFCEINLNLDQWFGGRCHLRIFLIKGSGGPFVWWSGTNCANLVEGIMKNFPVKLFLIWTSGSGYAV